MLLLSMIPTVTKSHPRYDFAAYPRGVRSARRSKMILEGIDWIFKEVPGNRGHSNRNSNEQTKLYPTWQTIKVNIYLGE